ncbi:SLBB domain-containing protein [Candidatus Desantisbacteria bacterium]|nr:SLBB domain-containing protein [Candidatus Desantisbacteria bacterium]
MSNFLILLNKIKCFKLKSNIKKSVKFISFLLIIISYFLFISLINTNAGNNIKQSNNLILLASNIQLPPGVQLPYGLKLEDLTPVQRHVIELELLKNKGQITPESLERLKNAPEFMDLKLEEEKKSKEAIPSFIKEEKPSDKKIIIKEEEIPGVKKAVKDIKEKTAPELSPDMEDTTLIKDKIEETKKQPEKEKLKQEKKPVQIPVLERFGMNFFVPSRKRMIAIEEKISQGELYQIGQSNAISGFVGPLDMVSSTVNATVPPRYALSPGDSIIVFYWGDAIELTNIKLVLDNKGEVSVPKIGRIVARGMTLNQFQDALKEQFQRVYNKVNVVASLESLGSIQVFITGEAFRPGSYAVSAVTTLFNALYACGGPNDSGSLREIRLLRNNETINVDFYNYLLNGDSKDDYVLQPGDTIFISKIGKLVSINGEVNRTGIFELKPNEKLSDLIRLANGIKPTGFIQRVQIKSIIPNKEKMIFDVDLSNISSSSFSHELFNNDSTYISSIIDEIKNIITIEGKVERPGIYELKKDMKISDLFSESNKPLGEAYLERADIVRLNKDKKTTTLIPVNLAKALDHDPLNDKNLVSLDKLIVYSKWDVQFLPARIVTVSGSVQKPGDYERSDEMTVKDLLLKSGGVMPNAYLDKADLLRYDFEKDITRIIPVNIIKALKGDESNNIKLMDKDLLKIYTIKESKFIPPHIVTISGSVQRPGDYERSDEMTVKDLLLKSGGVMPNTYLDHADLLRYNFNKEITTLISIDISKALEGEPSNNIKLMDKDLLMIYTIKDSQFIPPHVVTISGSVQRPWNYERSDRMTVKELIIKAGGVMPNTYLDRADLLRYNFEKDNYTNIPVNIAKALKDEKSDNIELVDKDILRIFTLRDKEFTPLNEVSIHGAVQRPGVYIYFDSMKLSDLFFAAGGVLPGASDKVEIATARNEGITITKTISLELLKTGDETQNIPLQREDIVMVRKKSEFNDKPRWVTIKGEIKYPGNYPLYGKDDKISDLIERAGGITKFAYVKGAILTRRGEYIPSDIQRADMLLINTIMDALNVLDYDRQIVRNQWLWQKELNSSKAPSNPVGVGGAAVVSGDKPAQAAAIGLAPGVANATGQTINELMGVMEKSPGVSVQARKFQKAELFPSANERVIINLEDALQNKKGLSDITLVDGDTLIMPQKFEIVTIVGAVIRPITVHFKENMKYSEFIDIAGGFTDDANTDKVFVLKVDGRILLAKKLKFIEPGDLIYVPPKVLGLEVVERIDKIISTIKFGLVTVGSVWVFIALIATF